MKPIFLFLIFSLFATVAIVANPTRVMDTKVRLNNDGFLEIQKNGVWEHLMGKNFPTRVLWPEKNPEQRPLTSFSQTTENLWTMTTAFEAFVSFDRGASWNLVLSRERLASTAFLNSLAVSVTNPALMVVGTSFHGTYISRDGGKNWQPLADLSVSPLYGADYHEQINTLVFSRAFPTVLYAAIGKEGDWIYRYNTATGVSDQIAFPGGSYLHVPTSLDVHPEGDQEILEVKTPAAYWRYETATKNWIKLEDRTDQPVWDASKAKRMEAAKDKLGFYVTAYQAGIEKELNGHLDFMTKNGLNAVVIDFKNDEGEVNYASKVPLALKIGAVKSVFDAPAVIKKIHDRGFYLIARVVVFKDRRLYNYNDNQYALWDSSTKAPWGNVEKVTQADGTEKLVQKEFWVDTYSEGVWNYNAAIAKELQDLGVDEVQFDYIRFPSDGPTARIVNRFKVEGMSRLDALESFLKVVRSEVQIPISVDIYGVNGYFVTDYLGQNMTMMSKYVDAISPMFYPSHFWKPFLWDIDYLDRARIIYKDGSDGTFLNTGGRAHVRPWVQAFLLGQERNFDTKKYVDYLDRQLEGVQTSKASGFLLWNASNRYYMVTKPVTMFATKSVLPY